MPHQCLKCGNIFPDGSHELLRGCSKCNGKRFFYTLKPVSKEEREKLTQQANKDFSSLIQNILEKDIKDDWTTISKEEIKKVSQEMKEEGMKIKEIGEETKEEKIKVKDFTEETKKEKIKIKSVGDLEKNFEKEEYRKEIEKKKMPKVVEVKKKEIPREKFVETKKEEMPIVEIKKQEITKMEIEKKAFKIPVSKEEFLIPDVITKLEDGVYEINLPALMENVSIVMEKNGNYKVHFSKKFWTRRR